ncbi:MAG TPA: diguanylate cyclase [Methylomirabilota bacterium]|nr:diguanylate cyclase [Methylomirabilota bacterium]
MAADVIKNLDRAKKLLERNRIEDAIEAYLGVLNDAPNHQEATQALGDLYARIGQPERAGVYYGMLFDLLVEGRDDTKALALYGRFLKNIANQPPERTARHAYLLQRQNRVEEAIEQFSNAAQVFTAAGRQEDAIFCLERAAQLDPDNLERHLRLADAAASIGKNTVASRAFLRAGQLASVAGAQEDALELLRRAHELAPGERGAALLYAEARLRAGGAAEGVAILEPLSATESDPAFLETFADALTKAGQLDRARAILEMLVQRTDAGIPRMFDLADAYAAEKQDAKAVEVLALLKRKLLAARRANDLAAQVDRVAERHANSVALMEFWASLYNELNRETRYFEILLRLFDAQFQAEQFERARDTLERLVEIDPYDHRNQQRLERLRARMDDASLKGLGGRLSRAGGTQSAPAGGRNAVPPDGGSAPGAEGARGTQQGLEDLIVQTEIFLQYSLQSKAVERLQKIAELFPGEEEHNVRLRNLYEMANWWPPGARKAKSSEAALPVAAVQPVPQTGRTGTYSADTLRDLSKISEITQKVFRQQTPRAMLNTTVNEVGDYLHASRTFAVVGPLGRPPELAAEYCAPGVKPASGAQVVFLISQTEKAAADELGGRVLRQAKEPVLADLGLSTALGVTLVDKETQAPAGMLIVAHDEEHAWKPNETFFLQAIGDQMLMSVSHTRLRSLVRRMGMSHERTGLLSRGSYFGCLLTEADRARSQGTPLSLMLLQIDRGAEILRQQGEAPLEQFVEQLARQVQPAVRQNDVSVRYTAWALAFILPDTRLPGARALGDKLRGTAEALKAPWDGGKPSLSAGIVEAVARADYDSEDVVTDLINRAEASLDEARRLGGNTTVALEIPKA